VTDAEHVPFFARCIKVVSDADQLQLALMSHPMKEAFPGIELGSVDGFQGREKEAIIVSLVRSNAEHEIGFLGEKRRLNVAMTRPKRHLCVVGDSERYPDIATLNAS